jgi:hypothetical protein
MKFKVASPSDRLPFKNKVNSLLGLMHNAMKMYGEVE